MFKRTSYKNGKEVSNVESSDGTVSVLAIQEVLQQFIASGKVQQNEEIPPGMLEEMNKELPAALARVNKKLSEEKQAEEIEVEVNSKSLIKYSNHISLKGIGTLTKLEHDIFTAIILAIRQSKTNKIKVPLSSFKKIIHYETKNTQETVKVLNSIAKKFLTTMVYEEYFNIGSKREAGEVKTTLLFNQYILHWDEEETYLYFELPNNVEKIFFDIEESFTQIMAEDILKLKTKYAKSLCHLLSRNFKGCFRIKTMDFRERLGFPRSYQQCNIQQELNKAIKVLIANNMFKEINYKCRYGSGKGRPVIEYIFDYQFSPEYEAKLHGQMTLIEGAEDTHNNMKVVTTSNTEEKIQKHIDFKLISNIKCPKCNGKVYARHCKKEGKHQGKIQLFCVNNEHYHKYLKDLDGKGNCNWTDYQSEKAVDLNNTTDKIVSKIVNNANGFDAEGTRKAINNYHDYAFEPKTTNTPKKPMSKLDEIISKSNLSPRLKYWLSYSDNDILYCSTLKDSQYVSKIDENEAKIIIGEKRKLGIPEVIPKEWR